MQTSSSCNAARGKLTVASISPTIFGFCPRPLRCYFSISDSKSALLTSSRCGGFKWPVTVSSFLVIFTGQTPRRRWLMLFAFLGPGNSSQRSSSQFKAGFFCFSIVPVKSSLICRATETVISPKQTTVQKRETTAQFRAVD